MNNLYQGQKNRSFDRQGMILVGFNKLEILNICMIQFQYESDDKHIFGVKRLSERSIQFTRKWCDLLFS